MRQTRTAYGSLGIAFVVFAALAAIAGGGAASSHPLSAALGSGALLAAKYPPATPVPTYTFTTVDNPSAPSGEDYITGVSDLGKIVGVYGSSCNASDPWTSWTSNSPYTNFNPLNYSPATATYLTSANADKNEPGYSGWACGISGKSGTWGVLYDGALASPWILMPRNSQEGTGQNAVMKMLGIDSSYVAVGYYLNASGYPLAFGYSITAPPSQQYSYYSPIEALGAQATGINDKGEIVGQYLNLANQTTGWFLQAGIYYEFSIPGATATMPDALNWQDNVVGSYADSAGKIHGFIVTNPTATGSNFNWGKVDDPKALGETVITGINDHGLIVGWYKGSSGYHGFTAVPQSGSLNKR